MLDLVYGHPLKSINFWFGLVSQSGRKEGRKEGRSTMVLGMSKMVLGRSTMVLGRSTMVL